jgi:hypothetical protein
MSKPKKRKPTPYQRILRAEARGTGCRLSYEDCFKLRMDDAIETRARLDDEDDELEKQGLPRDAER